MKPKTALYQLKTMPQAFLETNLLLIAGLHDTPSSDQQYYFGQPANKAVPSGPGAPNECFSFNSYNFQVENPETLQVHYLKMTSKVEELDVGNIPGYSLDGGSDIMVTGQLTKCTFCLSGDAALPRVAHVEPRTVEGLDSGSLRGTIIEDGQLAGGGAVAAAFGYPDDYSPYATVVGVRIGGNWQIYGQAQTGLGAAAQISRVARIL